MTMTKPPEQRRSPPKIPTSIERQIDENLKRLYQQALEQDLPDSLKVLVEKLRNQGRTE